jgi:hypothetical protein
MLPTVQARFDHLLNLLEHRPQTPEAAPSPLANADASRLVIDGIARRATPNEIHNVNVCSSFTVVESKPQGERRRHILWPKAANEELRADYTCDVPLSHVSNYLRAVREDCGQVLDLTLGFWQVMLSQRAQQCFGFRDEAGNIFILQRLPMGHSVSVEIMQLLTSVLAGDPNVVQKAFALHGTTTWVDGIRIAGTNLHVTRTLQQIHELATKCHATWKESPTTAAKAYEFVGVNFDHAAGLVSLGSKTRNKLPASCPSTISLDDLEALSGRLIFAAAVLNIPLARHYFSLKVVRRRLNKLNHGARGSDSATLPPQVQSDLTSWIIAAKQALCPPATLSEPLVIFTDASNIGWGAVIIEPSQHVTVLGDKWSTQDATLHINEKELEAVRHALTADVISKYNDLHIVVDNTSVEAAIRRGTARSDALAARLAPIAERLSASSVTASVTYIASAANPADAPSRGKFDTPVLARGLYNSYMRAGGKCAFLCGRV